MMQPTTFAGTGVGVGSAIALVEPFTRVTMYHLHMVALPTDVADAYKLIIGACFSVILTVVGGWIGKLLAKTGTPSAGK